MIRWISDRLGTAPAGSADIGDDLTVLDVRDLVDKHGNEAAAVRVKIDQGTALLASGVRLVVCCDYGISRSNAIAAGILAQTDGIDLSAAVRRVSVATGERDMKLEPLSAVRAALSGGRVADAVAPRLLMTGGSGFVGRALQKALGDTAHVAPASAEIDLLAGPLALDLAVKETGVDRILHLANPRIYTSNRALGDMLTMLRNVLDVCRANDTSLMFLSGWEVYSGYRSSELVADKSLPLLAKGPYGEAKLLCERMIEAHCRLYGVEAMIMRSSPVFGGDGDRPKFIYNFLAKAVAGVPIRYHHYRNASPGLDLLHVKDLVRALALLVQRDCHGTFNLGGGRLVTTAEVARIIVAATNSCSEIMPIEIDDDVANIIMDSADIRALGWTPTISAEVGLGEIVSQYREKSK